MTVAEVLIESSNLVNNWFEKVGFSSNGMIPKDKKEIYGFVFSGEDVSGTNEFFTNPIVLAAAQLAFNLHQNDKRRSGDPYFKHPLKTAYLASKMNEKLGDDYWEIMVAAAFLHDVIEIRRNRDCYDLERLIDDLIKFGVEKGKANAIAYLVGKLTPPPKKEEVNFNQRREKKQSDFLAIMTDGCCDWPGEDKDVLAEILKRVKVADIWANLEETLEDCHRGLNDGCLFGKPTDYVFGVFSDRIGYLRRHKVLSDDVIQGLSSQLSQLAEFLRVDMPHLT